MHASLPPVPANGLNGVRKPDSLVNYHFFEKDLSYINNLAHFLVFGYAEDCDHLIVVAGEHTVDLPERENIRYLFTENINNDFGGYCAAIDALGESVLAYEFVYFVNSSVRGPFLPAYVEKDWKEIFRAKLTGDVGLVGSTINILAPVSRYTQHYKAKYGGNEPFSHVQTMAYVMPRQSLAHLRDAGFYLVREKLDKETVIAEYELRLSQLILNGGWNITALLPEYGSTDYRQAHRDVNPTTRQTGGDPNAAYSYFGRSAHPFEVVFVKTNRGIFTDGYLERLAYSARCSQRSSQDWNDCAFVTGYLRTITAVTESTDKIPASESPPTVGAVLGWADQILRDLPGTRDQIEAMLERHRTK